MEEKIHGLSCTELDTNQECFIDKSFSDRFEIDLRRMEHFVIRFDEIDFEKVFIDVHQDISIDDSSNLYQ